MSGDPTRRKCTCEEHFHGGKYISLSTWYKRAKFREKEISLFVPGPGASSSQEHPHKWQHIHTAPTLHEADQANNGVVEPGPAQASGSGSGNLAPDIEDPEVDDTGLGMDAHEHENDLNDTGTGGQPQDSEMNANAFDGMGGSGHHLDHTDVDEPHDADNEDDAEDNPLNDHSSALDNDEGEPAEGADRSSEEFLPQVKKLKIAIDFIKALEGATHGDGSLDVAAQARLQNPPPPPPPRFARHRKFR
ncbi:hypothetical protein JB92DRAFT_3140507 [Gautieria morchelliformis]|nr:hypothetical protein JB92DRAFT_3140507 [Gautieria morchelliformis]